MRVEGVAGLHLAGLPLLPPAGSDLDDCVFIPCEHGGRLGRRQPPLIPDASWVRIVFVGGSWGHRRPAGRTPLHRLLPCRRHLARVDEG